MNHLGLPTTALTVDLDQTIAKLRQLTQLQVQTSWRFWDGDGLIDQIMRQNREDWEIAALNSKGHLAWAKGRKVRWLCQKITVPAALQGYPLRGLSLRLGLTWWAELAQVFVDGQLVQEGDLFDHSTRLLLSSDVVPGQEFTIAVRLVSPGHDDGALVRSICLYETPSVEGLPEPSFIADELAVLQLYLAAFEPDQLPVLEDAVAQIDWSIVANRSAFDQSLAQLRDRLLPLSSLVKQRQISLVGHAHLDMAWLWSIAETWQAAERTFESVLNLQKDFPDLTFCHSTPALYDWVEQNLPDLFNRIEQQVQTGQWEIVGGLWVEPELNLISGESLVRQVLYGQRYCQEKFGSINRIAWLPDTFGFNWQLPQFLKQGGIDYFVTQKLRWNDTTRFPYDLFRWQAPDGTEVFSFMTAPIGEGIDPIKMATYACEWEGKTGISQALWLPGVGDHGGGPTRDMLEVAQRWQRSPFFPQIQFTTAEQYLQALERIQSSNFKLQTIEPQASSSELGTLTSEPGTSTSEPETSTSEPETSSLEPGTLTSELETLTSELETLTSEPGTSSLELGALTSELEISSLELETSISDLETRNSSRLPIWNSELYLEYHRGCYTTHADQKRYNREAEGLLYEAELWASLATLVADLPYPKTELEAAWKKVLFNQFHDILPGSSIPEVFVDANQAWEEVDRIGNDVLQAALQTIAAQITLPAPPHPDAEAMILFNGLNWSRSEVVRLTSKPFQSPLTCTWKVCDLNGQEIASQVDDLEGSLDRYWQLSFRAEEIPAIGYRCFWLCPAEFRQSVSNTSRPEYVLENDLLRVTVDPATGDLASLFDKVNQREVLSGPGNQLQAFQDEGQYWDAWNIAPNYAHHPLPMAELLNIEYLTVGELETRIRVERQIGQSIFQQDYSLAQGSPVLKIFTRVNWQERHVLVKAAFPVNLTADFATYEIPCGAIQRTTRPETDREKAQWEVSALRWADLCDGNYGVSLLNDCKYGYDCQPNQIRLTLLRGTEWPDPDADRGEHCFTYAIYPHQGDWRTAQTVRRAAELNTPLILKRRSANAQVETATLPSTAPLLDLGADNLILMALKPAEDLADQWVLRCYESEGKAAQLRFHSDWLQLDTAIDLLERPTAEIPIQEQTASVPHWKIASFSGVKKDIQAKIRVNQARMEDTSPNA